MKKLFALLLTLCLLFGCVTVLAETAEENTMSGSYVDLDKIGMKIFIFDSMTEDADAEPSNGAELLYAWKDAEGGDDYFRIEAADLSEAGITTPEDFKAVAEASGEADSVEIVTLDNGLQVVVVSSAADNEVCGSVVYDNGAVIGFTVGPIAGQEESASMALGFLLGSLAPIE